MKCPKCKADNPDDQDFCGKCGAKLLSPMAATTKSLETPREELTTGSTFARRYKIVEELGKGGMGKVYRAVDNKLNEEVALKLIKPEIASDKKTIQRFSNELKLARKVSHRNVGRMYEFLEEKGTHFITMEYVPGQDLKGLIRQTGQLAVGTTISIAKQVCEGLSEAHRLGVIHRDLKPNNIMIDKGGNARIMDFGIARTLSGKSMTRAGAMIGTPEYMSPEQAEAEEVDHRSDIYSLGVILYEMVTGRLPFEGETALSVAMKHKGETPADPKEYNPQISDDLNSLILKCLEKDKQSRYQEAGELLGELKNIEQGIPTTDRVVPRRKTTTSKEISVTLSMRKVLVPLLLVVGVVVAGVVVWRFVISNGPTEIPSIAIVPFEDLSPNKDQEHFCKGLAYSIFGSLNDVEGLQVCGIDSSFLLKDQGVDIIEIGKRLGADTVLSGSIQKEGDRIRVTPVLTDVDNKITIWSQSPPYDREFKDIFTVEDDIKIKIVENLKINLLGKDRAKLFEHGTNNTEAYNFYLMGQFFWNKRTEQNLKKAIDNFEAAIAKDDKYVNAYVGLAQSYVVLPDYSPTPTEDLYAKAEEAALKAIDIDETSAEAHAILGNIMCREYNWKESEKELQEAIKLNPNYAHAHHWYAMNLMYLARFEEAIEEIELAHEKEPLSLVIYRNVGNILFYAGKYEQAMEPLQMVLSMDENFSYTNSLIGRIHLQNADYDQALSQLMKERSIIGNCNPLIEAAIARAYVKNGQRDEAQALLNGLLAESNERYIHPTCLAGIYFALGEKKEGFYWLDKAFNENDNWIKYLKIDHAYEDIRTDSEYVDLLKKINMNE